MEVQHCEVHWGFFFHFGILGMDRRHPQTLFSSRRNTNILRAFCESWCPTTITIHTIAGELSISLWDLYKLGDLPISGRVYYKAILEIHTLRAHNDKGNRRILKACESLLAVYRQIVQCTESKKDVKVLRVIHEGSGAKARCNMLNKNKNTFIFDDRNLDQVQMSYLSSLRSRQFGFGQDIKGAITRKVQDRSNVSYDKGSMSRVCAPCRSLDWHKLKIVRFHDCWAM
ncbi:ATP-binding cassette sub-family F member 2, partial [Bienertia sinuspersici]